MPLTAPHGDVRTFQGQPGADLGAIGWPDNGHGVIEHALIAAAKP